MKLIKHRDVILFLGVEASLVADSGMGKLTRERDSDTEGWLCHTLWLVVGWKSREKERDINEQEKKEIRIVKR